MDTSSFWAQPRPPRETFESVFSLWARAGALFFEGFDFVFGVMLVVGVPASIVSVAVETALTPILDQGLGNLLGILVYTAVSSLYFPWIGATLLYGTAVRLQHGAWPGVVKGLKWVAPRWPRLAIIQFVVSILFVIGLIVFVVPGIYVLVRLWFADAAVVFEPERSAFRRSWDLSRQAPLNILVGIGPFLLAAILFTFGSDAEALRQTPLLAAASEWSMLLLLSAFPAVVTALLYGWIRADEDAAAVARLE